MNRVCCKNVHGGVEIFYETVQIYFSVPAIIIISENLLRCDRRE